MNEEAYDRVMDRVNQHQVATDYVDGTTKVTDAHIAQTERMIQRLRMELRDVALMHHISTHGIDVPFIDCAVRTCRRALDAYADSEQSPLRGLIWPD